MQLSQSWLATRDRRPYMWGGLGRHHAGITVDANGALQTHWKRTFRAYPLQISDGPNIQTLTCVVVEDDLTMRQLVTNYLEENGIRAISASRRDEVPGILARHKPDLVVLDLRLGQQDGLDLLREIRAQSDVPVIITTGHRRDEIDRVVGLELGADDYLTKPFGLRELLARVKAVLRRRDWGSTSARDAEKGRWRFGQWQLDRRARRLTNSRGEPITLSKGEYALLSAFIDAPQRPLSREYLLQATRVHEDIYDRSIDVQVLRLRRKLETDPSAPSIIRTERGVGYVFTLPVERL
jgi:two-component system, OmpR family, response regulator